MKIIRYSEFEAKLKYWLNSVSKKDKEVIIKCKNQPELVLITLKNYNSLVETNYLLSGKNRDVLLESIAEVKK